MLYYYHFFSYTIIFRILILLQLHHVTILSQHCSKPRSEEFAMYFYICCSLIGMSRLNKHFVFVFVFECETEHVAGDHPVFDKWSAIYKQCETHCRFLCYFLFFTNITFACLLTFFQNGLFVMVLSIFFSDWYD